MTVEQYLPFWNQLTPIQQNLLQQAASFRTAKAGEVIHKGAEDCVGLLIVVKGRLRAYTISDEGREMTLYRLLDRDLCLFSASCMFQSIQFDVMVEAEMETQMIHIPASVYRQVMHQSAAAANYTNELLASHFSDVMWLMDQVLFKRMDSRLAAFLLEESELNQRRSLKITHETIARHLGSAREVVTRMLKYFQEEGLVTLSRGTVSIQDEKRLRDVARESLR